MNRYQRQKSNEIKKIMKRDKFGRMTYKEANKMWNWCRRFRWCKPCEDCAIQLCNEEFDAKEEQI